MKSLTPNWRDPLTYGVIVAILILIGAQLSGCSSRATPVKVDPLNREKREAPKTSEDASVWENELLVEIEALEHKLFLARADTARLKKQEAQARWENMARVIQLFAVFAMIGGVALAVLGFFNPALRPLRLLSGLGAGAALIVFGLASYLPAAAPWLGPIALALTLCGAAWLIYRLNRTGNAATGAIEVAEMLKEQTRGVISIVDRKERQARIAGKRSGAIDEVRRSLGIA